MLTNWSNRKYSRGPDMQHHHARIACHASMTYHSAWCLLRARAAPCAALSCSELPRLARVDGVRSSYPVLEATHLAQRAYLGAGESSVIGEGELAGSEVERRRAARGRAARGRAGPLFSRNGSAARNHASQTARHRVPYAAAAASSAMLRRMLSTHRIASLRPSDDGAATRATSPRGVAWPLRSRTLSRPDSHALKKAPDVETSKYFSRSNLYNKAMMATCTSPCS